VIITIDTNYEELLSSSMKTSEIKFDQ